MKASDASAAAPAAALMLFLPGAFAGLRDDLTQEFAAVAPATSLRFHDFVPSGVLAGKILAGAAADVYVSANIRYMEDVRRAGLVRTPRVVAGNRLCIIVRPDRAGLIAGLDDLGRDGLRLVAPQSETDPCGQYVVELFERAGLTTAMRRKQQHGELVHSRGSGDLPAFLADGRAEAGILYASEARALGDAVRIVSLPPALDLRERIVFTVGEIHRHGRPHPHAGWFIDYLLGSSGQDLLQRHGFLPAAAVGGIQLPWMHRDVAP